MNLEDPSAIHFGNDPGLRWGLFTFFSLLVAAALGLALFGEQRVQKETGLIVAGSIWLFNLGFLYFLSRTKLWLSHRGLRIRFVGVDLHTTWENVERLYLEHGQIGVVTRTPMEGKGVQRFSRNRDTGEPYAKPYDANARAWLAELRYVPLFGFEYAIRSGKLQAGMKHYLPDLPGVVPLPQPKKPAPTPRKTIVKMVLVGLGMATLMVLTIYLGESSPKARNIIFGVGMLAGAGRAIMAVGACWRQHKVLSLMYFVFAGLLALLSLACFAPDDDKSHHSSKPKPVPVIPVPHHP